MAYQISNTLNCTANSINAITENTITLNNNNKIYYFYYTKNNKIAINDLEYETSTMTWKKANQIKINITKFCFKLTVKSKYIKNNDIIFIDDELYIVTEHNGAEFEVISTNGEIKSYTFNCDADMYVVNIPSFENISYDNIYAVSKLCDVDFYAEFYPEFKKDLLNAHDADSYLHYLIYKKFFNDRLSLNN